MEETSRNNTGVSVEVVNRVCGVARAYVAGLLIPARLGSTSSAQEVASTPEKEWPPIRSFM